MKHTIILLSIFFNAWYVFAQDTLDRDLAFWLVKTSLNDSQSYIIREKMIFEESTKHHLKFYSALQDSGFVKLTPADSVYIDAKSSHQVLEIEFLEKSQQYILDSTFNEVEKSVTIALYTYDSLEILSIDQSGECYEIKFRVLNPVPTPFYMTWNKGENAGRQSFESTRYVRFKEEIWEIDRFPFGN